MPPGFLRCDFSGVNYFSDVLGAFAETASWLTLCLAVTHGHLGRLWTQSLGRTFGDVADSKEINNDR